MEMTAESKCRCQGGGGAFKLAPGQFLLVRKPILIYLVAYHTVTEGRARVRSNQRLWLS